MTINSKSIDEGLKSIIAKFGISSVLNPFSSTIYFIGWEMKLNDLLNKSSFKLSIVRLLLMIKSLKESISKNGVE
jgi:hypothetical protein